MSVLKARVNGVWVPLNGSDEVHIGPSDPTIASTELWVDTDEPNVMTNDMRWNTAWGMVALGIATGPTVITASGTITMTAAMPYAMLAGRRYRAVFRMRAANGATAPTTVELKLMDGATPFGGSGAWAYVPAYAAGVFNMIDYEWRLTGDGLLHSFTVTGKAGGESNVSLYYEDAQFYIEDIGPVSAAVPMVNPTPPWITPTLINGWVPVSNWSPPRYRKVGDLVYIEGRVRGTQAGYGANSIISTLPVDCRPVENTQWLILLWTGTVVATGWLTAWRNGSLELGYFSPIPTNSEWSINPPPFSVTP